jgi:hypothetical protein
MDPNFAMLALTGANQPALMASALASAGVAPPASTDIGSMSSGFGQGIGGQSFGDLGSLLNSSFGGDPQAGGPGAAAGGSPLDFLKGFKGPAPVKPIMSGGVSGSQNAPTPQRMSGSGVQQALQAMLMQGSTPNPLRVPQLGALLG